MSRADIRRILRKSVNLFGGRSAAGAHKHLPLGVIGLGVTQSRFYVGQLSEIRPIAHEQIRQRQIGGTYMTTHILQALPFLSPVYINQILELSQAILLAKDIEAKNLPKWGSLLLNAIFWFKT